MAGRPKIIDRDKVLDAAEAVLSRSGVASLSFDAVAKAAGITKGGVQYCFGTRENLIRCLVARWTDGFEADVARRVGLDRSPRALIRAHLEATRDCDDETNSRAAVVTTAMLQSPEEMARSRAWYREKLAGLNLADEADRRAAIAFMAGEGLFLLQTLRFLDPKDERCTQLLDAAIASIAEDEPSDLR